MAPSAENPLRSSTEPPISAVSAASTTPLPSSARFTSRAAFMSSVPAMRAPISQITPAATNPSPRMTTPSKRAAWPPIASPSPAPIRAPRATTSPVTCAVSSATPPIAVNSPSRSRLPRIVAPDRRSA